MDFKCMSIGDYEYGFDNQGDNKPLDPSITNVNFYDQNFQSHYISKLHPNNSNI